MKASTAEVDEAYRLLLSFFGWESEVSLVSAKPGIFAFGHTERMKNQLHSIKDSSKKTVDSDKGSRIMEILFLKRIARYTDSPLQSCILTTKTHSSTSPIAIHPCMVAQRCHICP